MIFLLVITLTSILLAAIMSAIAWRIGGDERRRSEARVATLSAEIHDDDLEKGPTSVAATIDDASARTGDSRASTRPPELPLNFHTTRGTGPASASLFVTPPRSGARFAVMAAGGAIVLAAAGAMAVFAGGGDRRAPRAANPAALAAPVALPLELVALGHERVGNQLTVRGVVRNPSLGAAMNRLTAVVSLFAPDGGFLASGGTAVELPALRPGGESTFVITVPRASDVSRYRVSFRTDDRVVPHLDRRHAS